MPAADALPAKASSRLVSLDLLRGATIAAMILVNNPGDGRNVYWPLEHAEWNGWTPTDLVFPFFLFMVGLSMVFSFSSRIKRGESRRALMMHVLRRGLVLFAIGVLLNGLFDNFHLGSWRIYGVLQRIAICYVISGFLALWTNWKGQVAAIVACLAGYWILMRYISVPGFGIPTRDIPIVDPDRNMVAWLDRKLLMGHLYEGTRDPEGVLSNIPAVATSLLGILTGQWLRSARSATTKAAGMLAAGVTGLALGEFSNLWFPINKKLWTSSFVIFTAGFALVCLAVCYWAVDIRQWRGRWTRPFLIFGMNAIAAYVFADLPDLILYNISVHANGSATNARQWIYSHLFAGLGSPPVASLLFAMAYVLLCFAAMWALYRKGIFLKI
jgi:predicted acyltransferase